MMDALGSLSLAFWGWSVPRKRFGEVYFCGCSRPTRDPTAASRREYFLPKRNVPERTSGHHAPRTTTQPCQTINLSCDMPSFQQELVAGTVGGCLGITVVYPLDTVKSRQVQPRRRVLLALLRRVRASRERRCGCWPPLYH